MAFEFHQQVYYEFIAIVVVVVVVVIDNGNVQATSRSRHVEDSQMPWNTAAEICAAAAGQRDQVHEYRERCDYENALQ